MLRYHLDLIILLLVLSDSGVVIQTTPELIFPEDLNGTVRLNIGKASAQMKEVSNFEHLAVFIKNEKDEYSSNAIQGKYSKEGNYLVFKPYFPFERGMTYIVRTINIDSTYSYQPFQIGKKKRQGTAKVVSIYPSDSQLPENLLRFYVYFNTPMKKGQALQHIKLMDKQGNIDHHAFMEFKQEIWSADGKRLTILFDPGRIKRGVSTNIEKGPALLEGKPYRLSISENWEDVFGQKLSVEVSKEFEVVKAYRHQINTNNWVIKEPGFNTYDPLIVQFDRNMDHALVQSMIKIVNAGKNQLSGYWEILETDQSIKFIPSKRWREGNYQIIIDSRLEDVAGNNLQNLLDYIKTGPKRNDATYHCIDFKI